MIYSEAKQGRVFIVRLEDGDIVQDSIEKLAKAENIQRAYVQVVGGADKGSILITGPEKGRGTKIIPMHSILNEMHEVFGFGTIFPDKEDEPKLHMHIACGREDNTITGEIRNGVRVWHVLEVLVVEIINNQSIREYDEKAGFNLLTPK